MSNSAVYLKPNIGIEPLYNQWLAWGYLLAPHSAAMFTANFHLKIMQSFVENPDLHVAANQNPAMIGGPYIHQPPERVPEVRALIESTQKGLAPLLAFAEGVAQLNAMLPEIGTGISLESAYAKLPEVLRGYVELTYDLNHRPAVRYLEGLLYKGPLYRTDLQSLSLFPVESDKRSFIFTTPRLHEPGQVRLPLPFRHAGIDSLFRMRTVPRPFAELCEELAVAPGERETFQTYFTPTPPRQAEPYQGGDVRVRYFGHACVLIETREVTVLTDPAVSYEFATTLPRYTVQDLPARIDYVLITHAHADHVILETLLQLRHRIGTVVVPKSNGGSLADPSLKLMFQALGFKSVVELDEMEELEIPGGTITGLPFFGEHSDLEIRSKLAHLVQLKGKRLLMAADSNAVEPKMYERVREVVGPIDVLFLGMESEGAPLSWVYGPLITVPIARKIDHSRRLNGSNAARGIEIIDALSPKEVFVYAMGQEPWLGHLLGLQYTEKSPQIVESNKLLEYCKSKGLPNARPYCQAELLIPL